MERFEPERQSFDLKCIYPYNTTMREWNLGSGDPLHLVLAADARLARPNYVNDHIWELDLGGGEPPALALRTTYGLRARVMRLFPRFSENGNTVHDPAQFAVAPRVRRLYPNFVELTFSPLVGLDVTAEYWVAGSNVVAGRIITTNRAGIPHPVRFEWVCQLVPLEGKSMTDVQRQSVTVLEGQVENLFPVLFLTGGPQSGPGPYPSLVLPLDLEPGQSRQVTWVLATTPDPQESFDLARRVAARPLDGEKARIELLSASQTFQITTGDPDWTVAFALAQKAAFGFFVGSSDKLPNPSFVLSRQPDQGFSRSGDGLDHQFFWSGQPPLESYYLSSIIPGAPELACGLLENFLAIQDQDGFVDGRPGLAGQRARFLAAPYLASLAWRIFEQNQNSDFIRRVYPALHSFFWSWFAPTRDQDRNGLPEWQQVQQTGFEENPLFDGWHPWALGVNITTVQSPALAAALYREADCLVEMAEILGRNSDIVLLKKQAETLRKGVEACWDTDGASYHYADRDTHLSLAGKVLSERQAIPELDLQKEFKQPVRLNIRIHGHEETLKRPRIVITGKLNDVEQTETLDRADFDFSSAGAVATSKKVYTSIGHFEFEGLNRRDRITIQTVDLTFADHTLLLPLWAGIPTTHEAQALVYRTILSAEQFDHPFGIPALPRVFVREADPVCLGVHLPWNHLIGEGLLRYGFRKEAARLVAHLMGSVIPNLKRTQSFYRTYHAETGAGIGQRNALAGLAPVGLFLQTLGVEILSQNRVKLSGENPYPWPVTVKYRGLTVTRSMTQTEITFPNGQITTLNDPTEAVISSE